MDGKMKANAFRFRRNFEGEKEQRQRGEIKKWGNKEISKNKDKADSILSASLSFLFLPTKSDESAGGHVCFASLSLFVLIDYFQIVLFVRRLRLYRLLFLCFTAFALFFLEIILIFCGILRSALSLANHVVIFRAMIRLSCNFCNYFIFQLFQGISKNGISSSRRGSGCGAEQAGHVEQIRCQRRAAR